MQKVRYSTGMNCRFEILGPATIVSDGEDAVLPSTKPSAILASLLLKCNSFVSLDYLKYALWGEEPPANADVTLPTYILRLRRLLRKYDSGSDPIDTMPRGYRITLPTNSDALDLLVFRRLLEKATNYRSSGEVENERSALQRAEKLWKGPALSNIPSEVLHREETPGLNDQWFDVLERRYTIDLSLGDVDGLAPQIRQAIAHRPERERYWEQLIEALYKTGRTTEALNEYRKVHRYLTSELGIEPRPSLQKMHLQVLRRAELTSEATGPVRAVLRGAHADEPAGGEAGAQAPSCGTAPYLPVSQDFVGRSELVDFLIEEVSDSDTPIVTLVGPPAVGKTEVAMQTVKRCSDRFAGGVYVAQFLRPDGTRRDRTAILRELLHQAGVEVPGPGASPAGAADTEFGLLRAWRAAVVSRPCLVVLDGARTSNDCVPLLPRSPEARVVVTSRNALPRLIAFHGARSHGVFPLSRVHSVQLLTRIIGDAVQEEELGVLHRISDICGGLPGALRLAGAKYVSTPHLTLTQFADLLESSPLDQLSAASESQFSLREQLLQSYEEASEAAQRLFLAIAVADGPKTTVADLFDGFPGTANEFDQALGELYDASLIHHCGTGHLGVFRLLREVASEHVDTRAALLVSNEVGG